MSDAHRLIDTSEWRIPCPRSVELHEKNPAVPVHYHDCKNNALNQHPDYHVCGYRAPLSDPRDPDCSWTWIQEVGAK